VDEKERGKNLRTESKRIFFTFYQLKWKGIVLAGAKDEKQRDKLK
jgi:hypothetical protein